MDSHSTITSVIDRTEGRDGSNKNDHDDDEEKEKNGEDHDYDFGQTEKERKSSTTITFQKELPRCQKPTTTSVHVGMSWLTTFIQEVPPHHVNKSKYVHAGPNITGMSSTTWTKRQIKEDDEISESLTTFQAKSSLYLGAAGLEAMETLKNNWGSICEIYYVPFNVLMFYWKLII